MIERGVLSRTVKLQLVVSKNAVEQRKATTTIFKCVLRSAVPSSSSWGVSLQQINRIYIDHRPVGHT
jgi:hypothetical protein